MSETAEEPEKSPEVESKEPPSPKNQLVALLTLLPVLGVLWLLMQYLPKLGDWMGDKAGSMASAVSGKENFPLVAINTEEPVSEKNSTEGEIGSLVSDSKERADKGPLAPSDSTSQKESYRSQIVEQFGGAEKVEIRHLSVSNDSERMVVALKVHHESEDSALIEVFFERDDFRRYISSEDSPVPEKLVLWSE